MSKSHFIATLLLFVLAVAGGVYYERISQSTSVNNAEVTRLESPLTKYYEKRSGDKHFFGGAQESDLPVQYSLTHNGEELEIELTAYKFFYPEEISIKNQLLTNFSKQDLVQQLKKQYEDLIFCHQEPAIQNRCLDTRCFCSDPAIQDFMKLPPWQRDNLDEWFLEEDGDNLILRYKDQQAFVEEKVEQQFAITDSFDHNHQVLAVFEYMRDQGEITDNTVLIHFDTHSDFFIQEDPKRFEESIADYVNTLISQQWITEMYWVLPDWTIRDEVKHIYWSNGDFENPYGGHSYAKGPLNLSIWVNNEGVLSFRQEVGEQWREIIIKRVLLQDLPLEYNQPVFVDIDADYFSNSGYDTEVQANWNPGKNELHASINAVIHTLNRINPHVTTVSLSPGYVTTEDTEIVQAIFTQ